ncbi:hypothetical protein KY334_07690 [Candidatus Woesearchaeota archaeon]|nr:hypothetical protein [Candidatus Woesearchaeota archaeon]
MLLRFLGIMDIFTALVIFFLHLGIGHIKLSLIVANYLVLKLIISYKSINGYIDLLVAVYIMGMHAGFITWFDYVVMLYLIQKGIFSLK